MSQINYTSIIPKRRVRSTDSKINLIAAVTILTLYSATAIYHTAAELKHARILAYKRLFTWQMPNRSLHTLIVAGQAESDRRA